MNILTLNAGSSSIKFALYDSVTERAFFSGALTHIATPQSVLTLTSDTTVESSVQAPSFADAVHIILSTIADATGERDIDAIAHRIVYGVPFSNHARITPSSLATLREAIEYDPEHLPQALALIDECTRLDPQMPQIACFDTVFHQSLPRAATLLPLPRAHIEAGAKRYGFHGLSYHYLIDALARANPEHAQGRVIIAHLGSGASITALHNGQSVETSMGFTPAGGLPSGTRSGDIDPGIFLFLADQGLGIESINDTLTRKSGLMGVSGISPHMHTLLQHEASDEHAADAIELFVHAVRKHIGAYTAVLGGLDALVFSGGIGEQSAPIRARICESLSYLGVHIDTARNEHNDAYIASEGALPVYVLPTNEELTMTRISRDILSK